jgi:hypothetical protein
MIMTNRRHAILVVCALCVGIFLLFGQSFGQPNVRIRKLIDFYSYVDSLASGPPPEKDLKIIKQKYLEGRWVSFIGLKGTDVANIVAVTLKPIKDVTKELSLTVQFDSISLSPRVGKIPSWGYIYDRDQDGKIDYMALLGGAAPIERPDVPDNFPQRGVQLTRSTLETYVSHCALVFNHWADDNFDGTLDGLVQIDIDPLRDWVMDQIVIRSTKYDGKFTDVWAFQNSMDNRADTVVYYKNKVPYHAIGGKINYITPQTFKEKTDILKLLNRAATIIGLKAENFPSGSEGEE